MFSIRWAFFVLATLDVIHIKMTRYPLDWTSFFEKAFCDPNGFIVAYNNAFCPALTDDQYNMINEYIVISMQTIIDHHKVGILLPVLCQQVYALLWVDRDPEDHMRDQVQEDLLSLV
jgi:hypothetical protein